MSGAPFSFRQELGDKLHVKVYPRGKKVEFDIKFTSGSTPDSMHFRLRELIASAFFPEAIIPISVNEYNNPDIVWVVPFIRQAPYSHTSKRHIYAMCHPDLIKRVGRWKIGLAIRQALLAALDGRIVA